MKKYTLIELLVAMGIFAFMMLLLMNFFSISTDLLGRENNRATKLYEGSIITSIMDQDFKNLTVDNTEKPFEYSYNVSGKTHIRFYTYGYNKIGESSKEIMVSYVYDHNTYEIYRYVMEVSNFEATYGLLSAKYNATNKKTDNFANIENSTQGSLILEGVERFYIVLYERDQFMTFNATSTLTKDTDFGSLYYSDYSGDGFTDKPDAITIQLLLNDKDAIGITGLENKNRRTITQQLLLGYND